MDDADIYDDAARWEMLRLDLAEVLSKSDQPEQSLISAALRALLDTLTDTMPLSDARARITLTLNTFKETN